MLMVTRTMHNVPSPLARKSSSLMQGRCLSNAYRCDLWQTTKSLRAPGNHKWSQGGRFRLLI